MVSNEAEDLELEELFRAFDSVIASPDLKERTLERVLAEVGEADADDTASLDATVVARRARAYEPADVAVTAVAPRVPLERFDYTQAKDPDSTTTLTYRRPRRGVRRRTHPRLAVVATFACFLALVFGVASWFVPASSVRVVSDDMVVDLGVNVYGVTVAATPESTEGDEVLAVEDVRNLTGDQARERLIAAYDRVRRERELAPSEPEEGLTMGNGEQLQKSDQVQTNSYTSPGRTTEKKDDEKAQEQQKQQEEQKRQQEEQQKRQEEQKQQQEQKEREAKEKEAKEKEAKEREQKEREAREREQQQKEQQEQSQQPGGQTRPEEGWREDQGEPAGTSGAPSAQRPDQNAQPEPTRPDGGDVAGGGTAPAPSGTGAPSASREGAPQGEGGAGVTGYTPSPSESPQGDAGQAAPDMGQQGFEPSPAPAPESEAGQMPSPGAGGGPVMG